MTCSYCHEPMIVLGAHRPTILACSAISLHMRDNEIILHDWQPISDAQLLQESRADDDRDAWEPRESDARQDYERTEMEATREGEG